MSFLKNWFPKKVATLEEFIALVTKEEARSISLTPLIDNSFSAVLVHQSHTSGGRPIIYRETVTKRNGSLATAIAFMVAPGATHTEITRLCLTGEKRMKELQQKIPHVTISFVFEGKVM